MFQDLPPSSTWLNHLFQHKRKKCRETITIQPGCEIVEKSCQCWSRPNVLCKEGVENIKRWDFRNEQVEFFFNYR
jgi:hypothetical protein